MIDVKRVKKMTKGWKNALAIDVQDNLSKLGNEDGIASTPFCRFLYKRGISDIMKVTRHDLFVLLQALSS